MRCQRMNVSPWTTPLRSCRRSVRRWAIRTAAQSSQVLGYASFVHERVAARGVACTGESATGLFSRPSRRRRSTTAEDSPACTAAAKRLKELEG